MSLSNGASHSYGVAGQGFRSSRPSSALSVSIMKLLVLLVQVPLSYAAPLIPRAVFKVFAEDEGPKESGDPGLWAYLGTAIALVLLGGAFAGLTIALMGQDEIYLQVIAESGEGAEKKNAGKVLRLLNKGKHWVLVTLLLSNVITNETLPIVLDRSLGGGWPAVLGSTVLIVIFGEIAPQSVCVRYGLPIGAWMAPFVLGLMWLLSPIAWPTAKLLDWLLGEDHGTVYKKAGLKTLVTLHKTLGTAPGERLNEDEVTIISAVLDLKDKPIGDIMTPMGDVFTMSADTVLDEKMMDLILSQGYSRIPIYAPENPRNFIGMLLVKILITYDPEDAVRVRDFSLATLPETAPHTSCLDIVNFFQEGKSHMVLVSDFPGENRGALGVVTLEDVIEELIGEEIVDESDVFVDVHRAIRRAAPAPRTKYNKPAATSDARNDQEDQESEADVPEEERSLLPKPGNASEQASRKSSAPGERSTTFMMRRKSSTGSANRDGSKQKPVPIRSNTADLRQHLKHLGPSNAANKPKATKYTSVKIKPGVGTIPESGVPSKPAGDDVSQTSGRPQSPIVNTGASNEDGGEGAGLLQDTGADDKNGASSAARGYGTISGSPVRVAPEPVIEAEMDKSTEPPQSMSAAEASRFAEQNTAPSSPQVQRSASPSPEEAEQSQQSDKPDQPDQPEKFVFNTENSRPVSQNGRTNSSHSTLGEMESRKPSKVRRAARSGSITENLVDVGGMKKMVLETNSSSDTEEGQTGQNDGAKDEVDDAQKGDDASGAQNEGSKNKKKKKKRGGKKNRNKDGKSSNGSGDSSPRVGNDD